MPHAHIKYNNKIKKTHIYNNIKKGDMYVYPLYRE